MVLHVCAQRIRAKLELSRLEHRSVCCHARQYLSDSVALVSSGASRGQVTYCALQESQDAAVNNPGSAYGASPLDPGAGSAAGTGPATSNGEAGTRPEAMPSQPCEDSNGAEQASDEGEGSEQPGLALPFEPVALVFRDIHYYVKQGGGDLELLRVSVPVCLLS